MYIYQFQDPGDFMPENNSAILAHERSIRQVDWRFFFVLNVQALKLLCPFFSAFYLYLV